MSETDPHNKTAKAPLSEPDQTKRALVPTVLILLWSKPWIETGRPIIIQQWKLGLWRWLAVLIGFAGVLMVVRPTGDAFTWFTILPLCAAFCYATNSVSARLFDDDVPTGLINLYSNMSALTGAGILMVVTGGYISIGSLQDWFWLAAMGAVGGTAVFGLISAYRLAEPSSLSPFEYFGIPFSFFLSWMFFAEAPFDRLIPGVFLIVGGGLVIVWREHVRKGVE